MRRSGTRSRLRSDDWLNAGLRLLADEGLAGVKIDVLASRLGVTKGSFYWHFESLSAFLEALVEHWCARRDAEVEAFPSSSPAEPAARLMYLMERISDPAAWNLERAIRAWAYSNPRLQSHVAALDEWAFGQVRNCFQQLGFAGINADIRKAPDNRHEEGNVRVLHRRFSESRWPRPCVGDPRGRSEALDRGARRPAIEPRNKQARGADVVGYDGRQHRWRRFREPSVGPRGVGEPVHACDLFMLRTGRSRDHPPVVMEGRVVRGRPRP